MLGDLIPPKPRPGAGSATAGFTSGFSPRSLRCSRPSARIPFAFSIRRWPSR